MCPQQRPRDENQSFLCHRDSVFALSASIFLSSKAGSNSQSHTVIGALYTSTALPAVNTGRWGEELAWAGLLGGLS